MGRTPCCDKMGLKKGPWSAEEDQIMTSYILKHGHPNWRALPKQAGLWRCGKSCRLRWVNYLKPDIKRGHFTPQENEAIIKLHQLMGNRWSAIAAKLPGRTDNEIKNIWHTHLKKKLNTKSHTSTSTDIASPQQQFTNTYSSSTTATSTTSGCPDHEIDESFWSETCFMQVDDDDINSSSSSSHNNIFSQAAGRFDQFLTTDDDGNTANHLEGMINSSNTVSQSSLPLCDGTHHAAAAVDDHDSDFWFNVFLAADCASLIHNLPQF